ncbi:hypothetical protein ACIQUS_14085 [Pseudomonas sp. NPDC090755]|uniref:hypothetical protein n=1 Tax=Pseudomonas sp. NPDC090755 TaxID=3364481 RepID=UPI00383A6A59
MNMKLMTLAWVFALQAGCLSYSSLDGTREIESIEASTGSPGAIADQLIPRAQKVCSKNKESWDYYWSCTSYYKSIGHALYVSGRYAEANDYIINYLMMSRISEERNNAGITSDLIQCNTMLYYQADSKQKSSPYYNARTALYQSLKASGDPRAKDYLAMAYLCQSAFDTANLEPVISDAAFLDDVEKFWGTEDRREAEFYIKNVKEVIERKRDEILSNPNLESGQYAAEGAIVYKNAYDFVLKNNLSLPYQQFLQQQYADLSH